MKQATRNLIDHTTPFAVVDFGDYEVRQYWTKGGAYGPQVVTVVFYAEEWFEHKTGGCGFNKVAAGLEQAFSYLGQQPKGMTLGGESVPYEYFVGGNFYKVPKSKIVKAK